MRRQKEVLSNLVQNRSDTKSAQGLLTTMEAILKTMKELHGRFSRICAVATPETRVINTGGTGLKPSEEPCQMLGRRAD